MTETYKKKALLVGAGGGHFTELLEFSEELKACPDVEVLFVSSVKDAKLSSYTQAPDFLITRPLMIVRSFAFALRLLWQMRPDVIISTGAEISAPYIFLGKFLFGCKTIYIECSAQVVNRSKAGRILYHFVDRFYVQWPQLLKAYGPKARFKGGFLWSS